MLAWVFRIGDDGNATQSLTEIGRPGGEGPAHVVSDDGESRARDTDARCLRRGRLAGLGASIWDSWGV
jgi:hypothetical protein